MNFSTKIRSYFGIGVRQRGAEYYRLQRLSYRLVGKFAAHAQVKGQETYACSYLFDPAATRGGVEIQMECSCPYFEQGHPCKHLWALALALDGDPWTQDVADKKCFVMDLETAMDHEGDDSDATTQKSRAEDSTIPWDTFKSLLLPNRLQNVRLKDEETLPEKTRSLAFVLDPGAMLQGGDFVLRFYAREHLKGGKLGTFKPITLHRERKREFPDRDDRELFDSLTRSCDGFKDAVRTAYYKSGGIQYAHKREAMAGVLIHPGEALTTLARVASKGKLFLLRFGEKTVDPNPLQVSDKEWRFEVKVIEHDKAHHRLSAVMVSQDVTRQIDEFHFLSDYRYSIVEASLHPTNLFQSKHREWFEQLTTDIPVTFKKADFDAFVIEYSRFPLAPPMQWPDGFAWSEEVVLPKPKLRLSPYYFRARESLCAEIIFQYPLEDVNAVNAVPSWVDETFKKIILRDFSAESSHLKELADHELIQQISDPDLLDEGKTVYLYPEHLTNIVDEFEGRGWDIEVHGKRLRVLRDFEIVANGETDWFDIAVTTHIDAKAYSIPQLLKDKKDDGPFIALGKGELALLPGEWLERFEILKKTGTIEDQRFRFPTEQALMLDSLLSTLAFDNRSERLKSIRQKIQNFKTLAPAETPKGFQGTLRDYQKEGLAWLEFLQDIGMGGCLADEMGLGKTIQVLAMLTRYHAKRGHPPSLIVVPRSLVTNWISEAKKFCPHIRVVDMSGPQRDWALPLRGSADIVLTTYGLLRQDIKSLAPQKFGYVVLDESQIIKNPSSQAAKAALILKSQHKLAMSGTPIENHLRELVSLVNFLNPGLLDGDHWQEMLSKKFDITEPFVKNFTNAVRPLMLRRSKTQVLPDLPPKIEDTLYCELEGQQKKHYEELRLHYQTNLVPSLQDETWRNSSIVVIEALLRLRQAACHSALVSEEFKDVPSAKIEALFEKLEEIRESGHKALIFSQFTSFLKIVRARFLQEGTPFEYLDGSTRDRAARTERFQNDPDVPFFLISLKAGGVGLNLTAADYCFILDPWWNPAAEAQAIDRAHRINQKNTVIAYRIIARGTVEEKIQALQKNKRDMVDSILTGESALLSELDLKAVQSLFQ